MAISATMSREFGDRIRHPYLTHFFNAKFSDIVPDALPSASDIANSEIMLNGVDMPFFSLEEQKLECFTDIDHFPKILRLYELMLLIQKPSICELSWLLCNLYYFVCILSHKSLAGNFCIICLIVTFPLFFLLWYGREDQLPGLVAIFLFSSIQLFRLTIN
jgi:hypothetical protein